MIRFPSAMALIEGTWTTLDHGGPTSIVYGTTGTLTLERQEGRQVVRIGRGGGESETGEPLHPTPETALNLHVAAILDARVRSAASGTLETVDMRRGVLANFDLTLSP